MSSAVSPGPGSSQHCCHRAHRRFYGPWSSLLAPTLLMSPHSVKPPRMFPDRAQGPLGAGSPGLEPLVLIKFYCKKTHALLVIWKGFSLETPDGGHSSPIPAGRRSAEVEWVAPGVEPPQLQDRQVSHVSAREPGDQRELPPRQTQSASSEPGPKGWAAPTAPPKGGAKHQGSHTPAHGLHPQPGTAGRE